MTPRQAIQVGAPLFSALGVLVGLPGTFLLTRMYHVQSSGDLLRQIVRVASDLITFRWSRVRKRAITQTRLAVNDEARADSLAGIYLLFISFALQLIGCLLWLADAITGAMQVM